MTYVPVALRSVLFWFVLAGLGHSVFAAPPAQTTFQSLFNGDNLSGWEGDTKYWRVENHAIVGEIPRGTRLDHNTWLVWRGGTVSDFELVADVKLTGAPSANSGIQFRCQAKSVRHVAGYQADLDQGRTWLGRIYDEHGRGLLVERGTRVAISEDGKRRIDTFAPASAYQVLFRPGQWNRYRIVAVGPHVQIFVNGTLFSELFDEERGEADREGTLALQLHAGPHTRVEFRKLMLRTGSSKRLEIEPFRFRKSEKSALTPKVTGRWPRDGEGRTLNLGFESGTLQDWTATGDAFVGQPVDRDGISKRWPGQTSGKAGKYFVGGYELAGDRPQGTLTSRWFPVDHPFASFLIGGGAGPETRVELLVREDDGTARVWFTARGRNREAMERVVVDLRPVQGRSMAVRLVDESGGGWGHLNFDDFRFHRSRPDFPKARGAERTTFNPVLQHLRPLRKEPVESPVGSVEHVMASMYVEPGFAVDLVAAEPQVHQPIAFTFDARGRLWVAEAHSYPQKRPAGEGQDQIIILEDADGDGRFEKRKVFAKGLNLVSGLEVGYGGVWVGAAPELLFIPDADGDDRPDGPPQVLLDGFGYADTHETLNNFIWGIDGWLYGNHGVFNLSWVGPPGAPRSKRTKLAAGVWRYHPTRHLFEVYAH
ncbi:MAG TPA: DUF1080 domain-containing protein, partial [Planctomycetaceae bacterium]|nr:DUF1080 domain-containing protein [Planctomycetaceae bacterium]